MFMDKYVLVTSNDFKLKEFKRFGFKDLICEKGIDLREVQSDDVTVVVYKAKDVGICKIVEDTSLHIEEANIGSNIKWEISKVKNYNGNKAVWKVLLAVNKGDEIFVYEGIMEGTIINKEVNSNSFGFDSYFIPLNSGLTLHELEERGLKDDFSARRIAVENFLKDKYIYKIKMDSIKDWEGEYQK
jgi:inosine/xanthosine triphosphate pyrophosphatase family protein